MSMTSIQNCFVFPGKRPREESYTGENKKKNLKKYHIEKQDSFRMIPAEILREILNLCNYEFTSLVSKRFLSVSLNLQPAVAVPINLYFNSKFNQSSWTFISKLYIRIQEINESLFVNLKLLSKLNHLKILFYRIKPIENPPILPNLTKLCLIKNTSKRHGLNDCSKLYQLSSLIKLKLPCVFVMDSSKVLTNLKELSFELSSRSRVPVNLHQVTSLNKLTVKVTAKNSLPFNSGEQIFDLINLTELRLSNFFFSETGLSQVTKLSHLKKLKFTNVFVPDVHLHMIKQLTQLHSLSLKGCYFEKNIDFSPLRNLKNLNLSSTNISYVRMNSLTNLASLERLNLNNCQRIGLQGIELLEKMTQLKTIYMGNLSPKQKSLIQQKKPYHLIKF